MTDIKPRSGVMLVVYTTTRLFDTPIDCALELAWAWGNILWLGKQAPGYKAAVNALDRFINERRAQ